jgi:hypothetical protein
MKCHEWDLGVSHLDQVLRFARCSCEIDIFR